MNHQHKLSYRSDLSELRRIEQDIAVYCRERGIDPDTALALTLCLDELFTNTLKHGYREGRGINERMGQGATAGREQRRWDCGAAGADSSERACETIADRGDADRSGGDRNASDRSASDRSASGRSASDGSAADRRAGADCAGLGSAGLGYDVVDSGSAGAQRSAGDGVHVPAGAALPQHQAAIDISDVSGSSGSGAERKGAAAAVSAGKAAQERSCYEAECREAQRNIEVLLECFDGGIRVSYCDDGDPFDPFCDAPPPPCLEVLPEHLPTGGFGIELLRKLSSRYGYERLQGRNRIDLVFDWRR